MCAGPFPCPKRWSLGILGNLVPEGWDCWNPRRDQIRTLIKDIANGNGGGLDNYTFSATPATLEIENSTFAQNDAPRRMPRSTTSRVSARHRLCIATPSLPTTPARTTLLRLDLAPPPQRHWGLISPMTAPGIFSASGDLNFANPLLGSLADNGGLTLTHALLAGSPAHQRGGSHLHGTHKRPTRAGFDRVVGGVVDMGAVEAIPVALRWVRFRRVPRLLRTTTLCQRGGLLPV